jgi:hypothetical protein
MSFNLGNERIQDTYQQLVQISGSVLLNGLGTPIPTISNISVVSASYALTASFALNGGGSVDTSSLVSNTTFNAYTSSNNSIVNGLVAATSSYARTGVNNSFSGTQNFVNISVSGTASIAHVETVTGSAVIIGEEFIILNAATPTARYAGIKIYDTGSVSATASLEWDGVQDTWILMEESGDTAVILTGMTGSRGSEAFPTLNTIQKGGGFNQLTDSNITDDGTTVTIGANLNLGSYTTSVSSGSSTGSLIDNIHPIIASSSAQIKHIVTLTQEQYFSVSGSGNANDDTFYIISDAGDNVYPGNLQVSGQIYTPTFAGSVVSSTSSVNFDNGNFATLNLTVPTFIANPSNLQSGTTYTIIIDSGSLVSNYGSAFKFAGGTQPTLSNGIDILTMVSDGTSLYATALADFQ